MSPSRIFEGGVDDQAHYEVPHAENAELQSDKMEPIAVIGLDLKLPQDAATPEGFFEMLRQGRSALTEVPKDRYNLDAFYHPDSDRAGTMNVRAAHFLREDITTFDAPFFSITPPEAACMDPQQRGLLETVYRAFENAGIPMEQVLGSKTSVYVGCFTREFEQLLARDPEMNLKYIATGTGTAMLSNRLSWFYDLKGASITLDTACSSSLNACHLACASLRNGEANMALVGGCNLFYNPETIIPLTNLGFLSPDNKCYSFDHRANGYSRGEGFGILVLKRLSDALRDNDTVRAVIRASSSNQDGKSPGITQPTKQAQIQLIKDTYAAAGLDYKQTRYFEAHGTGTPVGDPIEAGAIAGIFNAYRSKEEPLFVGAVKSNVGHLEGAAGIAALMKTIMVLESGIIPPNIWYEKPNPSIPLDEWNLKFPLEPTPWPSSGLRRASVNAFGYGGSNAHVVLEDAYSYLTQRKLSGIHRTVVDPRQDPLFKNAAKVRTNGHVERTDMNGVDHAGTTTLLNGVTSALNGDVEMTGFTNGTVAHDLASVRNPRVFVWSSFDEAGIKRLTSALLEHLGKKAHAVLDEEKYLRDLSYTLAVKRTSFPWRSYVISDSLDSLCDNLKSGVSKPARATSRPNMGYVFTGQGAQWYAMGREMMCYPVFKNSLFESTICLLQLGCRWSLINELERDEHDTNVHDPAFSQPMCAALQIALVEQLESWGIVPSAVIGHSSGEIAAAFAAGALSKDSALRVAFHRGALSASLAKTSTETFAMAAVALTPEEATQWLSHPAVREAKGRIEMACFNSPKSITVSGSRAKVQALVSVLETEKIFARLLKVENAYHSSYMEVIASEYQGLIAGLAPRIHDKVGQLPSFFSTVYNRKTEPVELLEAKYWVDNMVSPVRFAETMLLMMGGQVKKAKKLQASKQVTMDCLLEIGPQAGLKGPIREILAQSNTSKKLIYDSMLVRGTSAQQTSLAIAGRLHCLGFPVNLTAINSWGAKPAGTRMLVDLPAYAFNHSQRYWSESRLSKNFRFRQFPRHELLGAPISDWDPSEAVWRNFIRASENPWIRDHRVTGATLYPGAGMLVMAIEASRQLADTGRQVKGYRFREVSFLKALVIPLTPEGIETHFHLRPYHSSTSGEPTAWNDFRLCSYENGEWRENCRGMITTEYESGETPVDAGLEAARALATHQETFDRATEACRTPVDPKQLYEYFSTVGLDFGPTFQRLSQVRFSNDEAVSLMNTPNIAHKMPKNYMHHHVIHPSTLDAIFQIMFVALTKGGRELMQVMIPTSIRELWISSKFETHPEVMHLYAMSKYIGFRQCGARMMALERDGKEPWAVVEDFQATAVSGRNSSADERNVRRLCFNVDWKPDPSLLDQTLANKVIKAPLHTPAEAPSGIIEDVEFVCYMYLSRYLASSTAEQVTKMLPHHQKYISWMKHQLQRYESGDIIHGRPEWKQLAQDQTFVNDLIARLRESGHDGKLIVTVGENLPSILSGATNALEVLFKDKLVENIYRHGIGAEIGYEKMNAYIDTFAHKNPDMNILEIGAGTGGATLPVLQTLTHHGEQEVGAPRFAHYAFTDISAGFFEKAKDLFKAHVDRMSFRVFDAEEDPVKQGFEAEKYDLIIASNVIHATKNLDVTLANTRKLLRPGGKLVLFEMTNPYVLRPGFSFGVLPGWWLGQEEVRTWGPLMSQKNWDLALRRTNFNGADICLQDFPEMRDHLVGVIVATAVDPRPEPPKVPQTAIVAVAGSAMQHEIALQLQSSLHTAGSPACEIITVEALDDVNLESKLCFFLPELEASFLANMDAKRYSRLRKLATSGNGLFWLTKKGGLFVDDPESCLVTGLQRCLRSENPNFNFVTLAIDKTDSRSHVTEMVMKVFQQTFFPTTDRVVERSYAEKESVLHISRMIEADYLNTSVAAKASIGKALPYQIPQSNIRPLKLQIASPGLLDTLQFQDDQVYDAELGADEVEIQVKSTGLNFLDLMTSLGQVVGDFLGVECAGVISRVGSNVKFAIGERVCSLVLGAFKTFARVSAAMIQKIPDDMSFSQAAVLPVVFATAYYALYDIARMKKGETILIHWGSGGVGQAAIQLAQLIGAEIFVTVGSNEKRDLMTKTFGIQHDHIFSSRDMTFAQGIMRITGNRGVDVILNSMAGEGLRRSWECIAPFGRFVEIGKADIHSSGKLTMFPFKKSVMFASLDLAFMVREDEARLAKTLASVMELAREKKISCSTPLNIFPYGKLLHAFRLMQSGKHLGKIALEIQEGDTIMATPEQKPSWYFDSNATYVISGGLGGLGRSMARWMVSRRARNIILLSRSGAKNEVAQALVNELESKGAKIMTPSCDVSDKDALSKVLEDCSRWMPPIKGCIQGSMVLRDSIFENMSLEDFQTAIKPKVQGSWNLHALLPSDLDFFVLLSSAAGVTGNRGQANYCIGNTYQDALAQYRVNKGLKGVALDLGMILSVGFAAENDDVMGNLRASGFSAIREEEYLAILDHVCNPALPLQSALKSQVATGMETPAALKNKGIDEPIWMRDPLFRTFYQMGTSTANGDEDADAVDYEKLLGAADSPGAAEEIVCEGLVKKLCRALMIEAEDIDTGKPMHAYGVDSLVAVELRSWLTKEMGAEVAVFDIMGSGSIKELAGVVAGKSRCVEVKRGEISETV